MQISKKRIQLPLLQSALIFIFVYNWPYRTVQAQDMPPAKFDGFVYTNHRVDSDTIVIEAFLDPVCPDSRDAWAPLKQVIDHYGPRVWLTVHLLPLPYHDNAFAASRALHIVNALNTSATFRLLEWFFMYQERFYNAQTMNISRASAVKEIVKFASQAVGNSYYSAIEDGFKRRNSDLKTRVSFKYSASRGVSGTPVFFLNGFSLPDTGSAIDFNGWRKIIDPLVTAYKYEETMDRYQRVEKPRAENPIDENEIRITSQGRMRNYIAYAMTLLQEKGSDEIVFKAMGRAINKTVAIVELIKRRIVGLHQNTSIGSTDITDTWEPLEEGLLPLETTRHVSMITITLSKKELNTSSIGYQSPLPEDQVKAFTEFDYGEGSPNGRGRGRSGRGAGRGRGMSGNGFVSVDYEDEGWDQNRGYARGRGRGRGHSFRGRGRGGYNGPNFDTLQDGGYNNEAPGRGRGRGGYNGPNFDALQQDGGYNNGAPSRGRGRGRGRGNRGRGRGSRSNGPIQAAA
ncbi:Alba domain-containing protein/Thioredoxin_4 domain-containing protein [Cephalotus follicularis]|uniref:Alba domain-containing protein/Thioredoxin_4 domain-containing protein n=1 Tax=Cephalotus follicularis TaxID=3775 RepID=A0A1Q3D5H8_CEPFO|nr:Alba domain-containing protein/Thioredoxin_4 domain-containing protein [Cephalotus follicularis]